MGMFRNQIIQVRHEMFAFGCLLTSYIDIEGNEQGTDLYDKEITDTDFNDNTSQINEISAFNVKLHIKRTVFKWWRKYGTKYSTNRLHTSQQIKT